MSEAGQVIATDPTPARARRPLRGMGRVFQRDGSAHWWIGFYRRGKEYRESSGSPDRRQAERLLKKRLAELGAERLGVKAFGGPAQERLTVDELLADLETHYRNQGKHTPQVLSHLRPIREAFGDRRLG